jgi:CRISPR system Cascade subunit CasC
MKMSKLFVDFHVIQTVPPSCVNRDDTGSPKTAFYGGARRARVSSQCWKRAVRLAFEDVFSQQDLGVRTKKIVEMVAQEISALNKGTPEEEALGLAEKILNAAGVTTKDKEAKALFFMSPWQAKNLAGLANADNFAKKDAQAALNGKHGIDIALFGRMVADDPSLNVDASAQVAHAISTHRVDNDYDYFTAVDDRSPEDTAGAGMIGTVEFNSATLYRYATIAVHELRSNLDDADATAKAVAEFAMAFITAMPTGKQNTFANRTLPDAVLVTIRGDQPINFAGAFEKPVKSDGDGHAAKSVAALKKHVQDMYATFAKAPERTFVIGAGLDGMGEQVTLGKLYDVLLGEMGARL